VECLGSAPTPGWESDLPEYQQHAEAVRGWLAQRQPTAGELLPLFDAPMCPPVTVLRRRRVAGPWRRRMVTSFRDVWDVAVDESGRLWAAGPAWVESAPDLR
jgi:hypothetical protein